MDGDIAGDVVPIDLAGIYETKTSGFTERVRGLLAGIMLGACM